MTDHPSSDSNSRQPDVGPVNRIPLLPSSPGEILQAVATGVLLGLVFLYPPLRPLAWVVLVPLFLLVRSDAFPHNVFIGLLAGFFWFFISCHWLRHVTWAGWFCLAVFEGIWLGGWLGLAGRFPTRRRFYILPALWVTAEMLRSKGPLGFSWNLFGHLSGEVLIGLAQVWGVYGLSFLFVACNAFLAGLVTRLWKRTDWLRMPEGAGTFLALPVVWFLIGLSVYHHTEPPRRDGTVKAGLVQGNFEQTLKWTVPVREAVTRYVDLSRRLVSQQHPDILVWPEAALPTVLSRRPDLLSYLARKTREWKTPLLFGVLDEDLRFGRSPGEAPLYNSAVYLDPRRMNGPLEIDSPCDASRFLRGPDPVRPEPRFLPAVNASPSGSGTFVYDKARLLPFGEYVPFRKLIPFVQRFVETRGGGAFASGRPGRVLTTGFGDIGPLICFESTFPGLARSATLNGAEFLVNLTNDAWYLKTAAQRQHALQSRFRAIESGRVVVRVANTGISGVFMPDGSFVGKLPPWEPAAEVVEVPLYSHLTFHTRVGDFGGWLCLFSVLVLLGLPRETAGTRETEPPENGKSATDPPLENGPVEVVEK